MTLYLSLSGGRTWFRTSLLVLPLLGGCATLPSSGPTAPQVTAASDPTARLPARLIELNADTVPEANSVLAPAGALARLAAYGEIDRIGPGDVLQISVFEIGTTLFSAGSGSGATTAGQPSAAGSALPPITVAGDGTIAVPYAGRIDAAGQTSQTVALMIEGRLRGLSEYAQVTVAVRENLTNSVFVLGGVKTPGRIPLSLTREHVLDAIALAGGGVSKPQDTTVRVTRGRAECGNRS